jgi:hypothetical protein
MLQRPLPHRTWHLPPVSASLVAFAELPLKKVNQKNVSSQIKQAQTSKAE